MSWEREYLDWIDDAPPRRGDVVEGVSFSSLPPFAKHGRDVTVWPLAKIVRAGAIEVGDHVIVDDFVFLDGGARTRIGSHVHVAVGAVVCGGGTLEIGDFSNIASGARIYTGTDDVIAGLVGPTIPAEFRSVTRAETRIGRHVQILANAVVQAGCVIPDGVVLAPGTVARAKDIHAPWTVYGGAPARVIGVLGLPRKYAVEAAERRLLAAERRES